MDLADVNLDVLLYNIMTHPELSPPDILGLCRQHGFILLCRLPKVGIALMNRYYPDVPIDMNNPWKQFKLLAEKTKIRYISYIDDSDIDKTINYSNTFLFQVPYMENYRAMLEGRGPIKMLKGHETEIYVDVYGVSISGKNLIGGTIEVSGEENEYQIYKDKDEAIKDLWDKLQDLLDEQNEIRGRDPIDYKETYKKFSQDLRTRGYSLYHFYEPNRNEYYDGYYGTIVFSIHEDVDFKN